MPASQPHGNGPENNGRPDAPVNGLVDLIAEAEAIRDVLHQATGRTAPWWRPSSSSAAKAVRSNKPCSPCVSYNWAAF